MRRYRGHNGLNIIQLILLLWINSVENYLMCVAMPGMLGESWPSLMHKLLHTDLDTDDQSKLMTIALVASTIIIIFKPTLRFLLSGIFKCAQHYMNVDNLIINSPNNLEPLYNPTSDIQRDPPTCLPYCTVMSMTKNWQTAIMSGSYLVSRFIFNGIDHDFNPNTSVIHSSDLVPMGIHYSANWLLFTLLYSSSASLVELLFSIYSLSISCKNKERLSTRDKPRRCKTWVESGLIKRMQKKYRSLCVSISTVDALRRAKILRLMIRKEVKKKIPAIRPYLHNRVLFGTGLAIMGIYSACSFYNLMSTQVCFDDAKMTVEEIVAAVVNVGEGGVPQVKLTNSSYDPACERMVNSTNFSSSSFPVIDLMPVLLTGFSRPNVEFTACGHFITRLVKQFTNVTDSCVEVSLNAVPYALTMELSAFCLMIWEMKKIYPMISTVMLSVFLLSKLVKLCEVDKRVVTGKKVSCSIISRCLTQYANRIPDLFANIKNVFLVAYFILMMPLRPYGIMGANNGYDTVWNSFWISIMSWLKTVGYGFMYQTYIPWKNNSLVVDTLGAEAIANEQSTSFWICDWTSCLFIMPFLFLVLSVFNGARFCYREFRGIEEQNAFFSGVNGQDSKVSIDLRFVV